MERQSLLQQLESAWLALRDDGRSLALISPVHAEGLVAPIFTDREDAQQACGEGFSPQAMPPLWQTAQLLAAQGFAGLMVDGQLPLFFVTTEPGSARPSHVAIPQADDFLVVGREGESALGKVDVELWFDLPAFDQLSIEWLLGDRLPFHGYEPDMVLWEYLPGGQPQPVTERGALLPVEQSGQRALPLFSAGFAAEWYWHSLLGELPADVPPVEQEIFAHDDVVALLEARAALSLSLILNPSRHRFHQGFFRKLEGQWYLVTINGVWAVRAPFHCAQVARRAL